MEKRKRRMRAGGGASVRQVGGGANRRALGGPRTVAGADGWVRAN